MNVLRWHRSAYETDASLALERDLIVGAGATWRIHPEKSIPDLNGIDVLAVTSKVKIDDPVCSQLSGKLVVTTTSGFDHIDLAAAARHQVTVARSPLARRDAVVEFALGSLCALSKAMPTMDLAARGNEWARARLPKLGMFCLADSPVAVIGGGVIGQKMARVLRALDADVRVYDPIPARSTHSLADALNGALAVTLHCSLSPTSRQVLDAAGLDRLAPGAIVVNTARGDVMDYGAALKRVHDGRLAGLAADVFAKEPWPELGDQASDKVLLYPHAAGYASGLGERVAQSVARAVAAWANREPVPFEVPT